MKQFFTITIFSAKRTVSVATILFFCNAALIWIYAAIWPSFANQTEALNSMISSMPPEFLKAFNVGGSMSGGFESLLVTKHFSMLLPIFMLILGNSIAGGLIANEVDKRSILLTLGQPISRTKLYWAKYTGGAIAIIVNALSLFVAIPFARMYSISLDAAHVLQFVFQTLLLGFALYSFAYMISAASSEQSKVSSYTVGIFVIMYVVKLIAELKESLSFLKYWSILYYYGPSPSTDNVAIIVLLLVSILCALQGHRFFVKRDIQVR